MSTNKENKIYIHLNLCINKTDNQLVISDNNNHDYKIECDLCLTDLRMNHNELLDVLLFKISPILIDDFIDNSLTTSENKNTQNNTQNKKIKINYASEKELLKIEGMKLIHVKKIIQLRNNNQFISNKNDLLTKIGINDFEIENIVRQINFEKRNNNANSRYIDL